MPYIGWDNREYEDPELDNMRREEERTVMHRLAYSESQEQIADFPVITICGSMRFYSDMLTIASGLTGRGFIVLMPFVKTETQELKEMLDTMHFCKIDMSSAIYVVNIDGHIGESTEREIAYAHSQGKNILYHKQVDYSEPCYVCTEPVYYQSMGNGEEWALRGCGYCNRVVCEKHSFSDSHGVVCCNSCWQRQIELDNEQETRCNVDNCFNRASNRVTFLSGMSGKYCGSHTALYVSQGIADEILSLANVGRERGDATGPGRT